MNSNFYQSFGADDRNGCDSWIPVWELPANFGAIATEALTRLSHDTSVLSRFKKRNDKIKVGRYSFSRSIPPKFERKLRRHKQRLGKIDTTVVLDKDENLLWSGLQWHRSCHSNEMTPLPILLAAVFLGTGNCSSKIVYRSFFLQK